MTMTTEMTHTNGQQINGQQLSPRGSALPALITDEHRTILRQMVDRNATAAQVEMLIVVGNRYDLDPLMGHVVLINGKCFVTHKGLMHKAHASGTFDGIETQYGKDSLGEFCECQVFRKDMGRPFSGRIYLDEYRSAGPVWKQYPRAMAAKTAESFVLRRAFDVSLTSQEEMGVDRSPEATGEAEALADGRVTRDGTARTERVPAEQRAIEQRTPEQKPAAAPAANGMPACGGCGKVLTKAQNDLSVRNYGQPLCPACQREAGAAAAQTAAGGEPPEDPLVRERREKVDAVVSLMSPLSIERRNGWLDRFEAKWGIRNVRMLDLASLDEAAAALESGDWPFEAEYQARQEQQLAAEEPDPFAPGAEQPALLDVSGADKGPAAEKGHGDS